MTGLLVAQLVERQLDQAIYSVQLGVALIETDAQLPHQKVAGEINWGDGSPVHVIDPASSPHHTASAAVVTRTSQFVTLELTPAPYTGQFRPYYGVETGEYLSYAATSAQIQSALKSLMPSTATVEVTGASPRWYLKFGASDQAAAFDVGVNALYAPVALPVHNYAQGSYTAYLTGHNFKLPAADTVTASLALELLPETAQTDKSPILVGPILPADVGYPNAGQWNFNVGTDVAALASNVKLILLTVPGERIMMPNFGCNLRRFLFNQLTAGTDEDISSEIRRSISTWEPRVEIQNLQIERGSRASTVDLLLTSILDRQHFHLNVRLER